MRKPSPLLLATLAAVFAGAFGCSRCGKAGSAAGGGVERLLPRSADLLVVVPELRRLGDAITRLQDRKPISLAAQLQGMPTGGAFLSALFSQVGLDPRSGESLDAAGVDGARGLGLALFMGGKQGYSVLPVKDEAKLKAFLAALAKNRLGAPVVGSQALAGGGPSLTVFSTAEGAPPMLGYLLKEGYALVAPGESLAHLADPGPPLAGDPHYDEGARKLPGRRELMVHVPEDSRLLPQGGVRAVSAAITATEAALNLDVRVVLRRPEAAALFEARDAPELAGYLPEDAFLVTRYRGDPLLLSYVWPRLLGPAVEKACADARFDVNNEVLQNLKPGAVVALALSPSVSLASGMPELDVRRTNPFRYVNLVAVAQVRDRTRAEETLRKLPPVAARFGAKLDATEKAGKQVYQASYAQGEGTHVALAGDELLLASPMARLEQALARAERGPGKSPLAPELAVALEGPAVSVVLDLQKLVAAVRQLPDSAWGLGGFAMKASALRWLEGVSDLRGLWLTARAADGAVDAELSLRFVAP